MAANVSVVTYTILSAALFYYSGNLCARCVIQKISTVYNAGILRSLPTKPDFLAR
jgi:hypothetical protein